MKTIDSARGACRGLVLLGAALGAGCASFSPDGGFDRVAALTQERVGRPVRWQRDDEAHRVARARVDELLARPLDADGAVEVALLNERGLQARLAELGIAEADLVAAGRLRNPSLRYGRLQGGAVEVDRAVVFDLLGLLTMPLARRAEQQRFEQAQLQAAADALGAATQARLAFFGAVAARQRLDYAEQVMDAADAASELARRMREAGQFNELAQLREQAFQAEAAAALVQARHDALAERERLARALGLGAEAQAFTLPESLPELPAHPAPLADSERLALERRLDLLAARRAADAGAQALGLAQATRFVDGLQVGVQDKSVRGEPRADGFEVELELPLFDGGSTRSARAQARYRQALDHAAELAGRARSEVREAHSAYLAAFERARTWREQIVPLRERIARQNLLRYNGMLIGVFDLLADAREQVAAVSAAVDAQRDFWVAETNLQTALTAGSPAAAGR